MKKYQLTQARKDLPRRPQNANKTHGGKALVIAGSPGMQGAAVLTATAAARVGAGYVYLASDGKIKNSKPDFLSIKGKNVFSEQTFSAVAFGPGLSQKSFVKKWLREIRKKYLGPLVIDAGALDVLKGEKNLPENWLLTPHEGELARLLAVSSQKIRSARSHYLQLAQKKYGCVVLLKGFPTLIADGKNIYEIRSGNPALAKAGTGDVLTGMIVGFLAQGVPPVRAACLAAFVHGKMAHDWVRSGKDVLSLMASDLLLSLPSTLRKVRH